MVTTYDTPAAPALHSCCVLLQVSLQDVSASYINPSLLDPCEEFTFKQRIGLQGALGPDRVTAVNGTAISVDGPVTVNVLVQDGQQRTTGGHQMNAAATQVSRLH